MKESKEADVGQQDTEKKIFTKEQLLTSERFRGRKDLLNALLSAEKTYTVSDVEEEISKYMKRKVE